MQQILQPENIPGLGPIESDFFAYQITILAIAAGGLGVSSFTVDQEADFEVDKLSYLADDNSGNSVTESTQIVPIATIKLQDSGNSRPMVQDNCPISAVFGRGNLPFVLPRPKIIIRGSTITASVQNNSTATVYNIRLVFIGQKLFSPRNV